MENQNDEWNKVEPKYWNPEKEGDSIEGILFGKRTNVGEYKSNAYDIQQDNGEVITVFGSTVLDDKMAHVQENIQIRIVFKGTVSDANNKKKPYKNFEVFTKQTKE